METEQSLHDHARARKRKQRATASQESRTKEREHDRVRKKQCLQGESTRYCHWEARTTSLTSSYTSTSDRFAIFSSVFHLTIGYRPTTLTYILDTCARQTLCACVFLVSFQKSIQLLVCLLLTFNFCFLLVQLGRRSSKNLGAYSLMKPL